MTNTSAPLANGLTVDRLFGPDQEFKMEKWGPARWMRDGSGYTTLEAAEDFPEPKDASESKDIVHYDLATGCRQRLVAARELIPAGQTVPLTIENYALTEDADYVLIFTNAERVWREMTQGDYWLLHRPTGRLQQLGGAAAARSLRFATFSPDGTRVAYVCHNNLFVQSLADWHIAPLTADGSATTINGCADWVNEEEFGLRQGYRWSPDGAQIAYWQFDSSGVREFHLVNNTAGLYPKITSFAYPKVGERNSACRVGVVAASGGLTRWFDNNADPRNHYIPRMEWAPDSQRVVFQQLNRLQNANQVLAGDPATGASQVLFTERDEAWVEVMEGLRWIEGGRRFLWLSERDGWQHLYAVSASGESIHLLTPGPYDVISLAGVDEELGWAYFIASPDNATQRYLYRAPLDGSGAAVRVSPADQPGTHSYDLSKDGRWAFHSYSSFGQPPVVALVRLRDHHAVRILAGNVGLREKLAALPPCAVGFFLVPLPEGPPLDAWCIKPPHFDPERRYPLLIHVYGEPAAATVVDRWGGENYLWHTMLAQQGYVVMCIDNRGTPSPRGRAWRKSIYRQIGILGPSDQAEAVREILRSWPCLDPQRVGVWGHSGGGSMSLHAIFRYPELYQVAMALSFVANQRLYDTIYQERYMGLPEDNEVGFADGSPITHAHQLEGKLLLVYGTGDDNCHYQNCELLINELIKHNKPFSQMSYPNCGHGLDEGQNTKRHLYATLTRYLLENLPVTDS